ncbi:LOW QUALITY PROTEIN: L-type lectin-domain containing receptor kinase IX.1-like [Dioscorea cayenensis subsp. rotundata]|uniref:non-specific serine/threonine protein kinase n=1 Tax=Dioscorea cayennensis subsp. rotundata TaxID=55577 RepID=A0AB40B1A8_DIOCR|nr:LOW QUALITY PROTEIN: L-type lectin-domain containing receptor kinase IX.1-like [Dioscorea cayenensis subsp. rotundata]
MASFSTSPSLNVVILVFFSFVTCFVPAITSYTLFNFTSFSPNTPGINYSGDAYANGDHIIQLTRNQADGNLIFSAGHVVYTMPIKIWDMATGFAADFVTHFNFNIKVLNESNYGDGLAFFMAPVDYKMPLNATGQWLGLYNTTTNNSSATRLLAVEFDTYKNRWDPDGNHIGINFNSIVSNQTMSWHSDLKEENQGSAWIGYNSTTNDLYVFLSYDGEAFNGTPSLAYNLNLSQVLPPTVIVGLSASTGHSTELHQIIAWDFNSCFGDGEQLNGTGPASHDQVRRHVPWLVGIVIIAIGVLVTGIGYFLFAKKEMQVRKKKDNEIFALDRSMEDKFVQVTGPRRFTYKELIAATKNFNEQGKLGQGGFGGVYLGVLSKSSKTEKVAVKKIAPGSSQGRKEYVSEVTVISRLRHRNLVRLIGWCHEYNELLLVYEYMPNGSLDSHLFGKMGSLEWPVRYKIAHDLASALLYLHEEWEQCVVHRDVKSSNVMLDSSYNAKLGDFGLARFVDHGLGSQTTVLAGTMGYLAPECVTTSKASKESDVYSFGVVALEIACGRKPVDPKAGEAKMRLVDWVWELYGQGRLIEAVDERLNGEFEKKQVERLMTLGLWCAHPDHNFRPSIRQAIQVLTLEAPLPSLPATVPQPTYYAPPLAFDGYTSTGNFTYSCKTVTTRGHDRSSRASSRASSADTLLDGSSNSREI